MRRELREAGLKSITSEICREQEGKRWKVDPICCLKNLYVGESEAIRGERDITCMLKTSSELSDCPVMLLTSLEA